MGYRRFSGLLVLCSFLAAGTVQGQAGAARPDYRDPTLPTERRVEDLLARMTLEEKVAQMLCLWGAKRQITDAKGRFDPARAPAWFRVGIGRIERPSDGHGARAEAEFTNAIQRWVKEHTRLGIPVIFHEEALHGLQGPEATSFPQAIALASTWDPDLVERVFATVAHEVRARGAHQVLAPVADVARDPRWGRFEETYGEDPYLVSRMGLAAVRGFQGNGRTIAAGRVIATLKHMAGHGQPESGTNTGPASLGERTLRDIFFPPFEVAVKQGHARSVMPSYNEIDGIPSHANRWMLHDVLRGEWGFDGVIVSDWQAIRQLATRHHVAADDADAARQALEATVDVELPDPEAYPTLVEQVRQGKVSEAALDDAVRRLLRAKFELGLFEDPFVDPARADAVSGSAASRPLALEAARRAIVLFQNRGGLLPLQADRVHRVAVIGPHAAEVMLGGYSGVPRHSVSILEGIRRRLGPGATVDHAEGVRITEDSVFTRGPQPLVGGTRSPARWSADRVVLADPAANRRRIAEAVALARASDVAIVVVGDNEQTAREAYAENHLGDRADLRLVGQQEDLVRAVLDTGKPTVVVLINGRPPAIPALAERAPALLEGWYLGQEGGTAVAEVLFGDVNPGGKLPVSFPRGVGQLPVFYNHKPTARRGYLFESTRPLFPFGHGLSYTTFSYSTPTVVPARIPPDGRTTASVEVTNTGARAGDEVVQLYVRAEVSRATRPVLELKGFRRIRLAPGERRTVTFELGPEQLAYHGPGMKRVVEPGRFRVMVGGSSEALKSVGLDVAGLAPLPTDGVQAPAPAKHKAPDGKSSEPGPAVQVVTYCEHLPASAIEKTITNRIESWVRQAPDVRRIESHSIAGVSRVRAYFSRGTDPAAALTRVNSLAQNAGPALPPGASRPVIMPFDPAGTLPVGLLCVRSAERDEADLKDVARIDVRNMLGAVKGCLVPVVFGGRDRTLLVYLDPGRLRARNVSPQEVIAALRRATVPPVLAAADSEPDRGRFAADVRAGIQELNDLPIRTGPGEKVLLKDVGRAEDGLAVQTSCIRIDGRRGVCVPVFAQSGPDPADVRERLRQALPRIERHTGPGTRLTWLPLPARPEAATGRDTGLLIVRVRAPSQLRLGASEKRVAEVERFLQEQIPAEERVAIVSELGVGGGFAALYTRNAGEPDGTLSVVLSRQRRRSAAEYAVRLRRRFREQPRFADLHVRFQDGVDEPGFRIQIVGGKPEAATGLAREVRRRLARIPGAAEVEVVQRLDAPLLTLDVDRHKAADVGLSAEDVRLQAFLALGAAGLPSGPSLDIRSRNAFPVAVRYPEVPGRTPEDALDLPVAGGNGSKGVKLRSLVNLRRSMEAVEIDHIDGQRVVTVAGDVENAEPRTVAAEIDRALQGLALPAGRRLAVEVSGARPPG